MIGRGLVTGGLVAAFAALGFLTVADDQAAAVLDGLQRAGLDVSTLTDAAPAEELTGRPRVVDGDTLAFGRERVRLLGIDAPESNQRCAGRACGAEATQALRAAVAGHVVRCTSRRRDDYGRALAVCYAAGRDLNAWMVRQGQAVAAYGDQYEAEQEAARRERAGLWRGPFDLPCRHRGTC